MNIFTALVLSTQQQALSSVAISGLFPLNVRERYRLKVTVASAQNEEDVYRLEIFRVDYPDARPGKGWGAPCVASVAHVTRDFTEQELIQFCEKHGFSLDTWQPCEPGEIIPEIEN